MVSCCLKATYQTKSQLLTLLVCSLLVWSVAGCATDEFLQALRCSLFEVPLQDVRFTQNFQS